MNRGRRVPDIGLFFFGAVQNDNVFLVAIRVDPVCVKSRGEVVADILAAIKERRAEQRASGLLPEDLTPLRGFALPARCWQHVYSSPLAKPALRSQRRGERSGRLVSTLA